MCQVLYKHLRAPELLEVPAMMEKIDLNSASPEDIEGLCGLEPYTVQSLVRHRPLRSYDQLEKVPGMGPLLVMTLRKQGCLLRE